MYLKSPTIYCNVYNAVVLYCIISNVLGAIGNLTINSTELCKELIKERAVARLVCCIKWFGVESENLMQYNQSWKNVRAA